MNDVPTRRGLRGGEVTTTFSIYVCTACGCCLGREEADWEAHQNWHRLLRNLTAGDPADAAVPAAAAGPGTAVVHELEFLDREARPAIWHARCSAPNVPLEQTTSVPQNITCPACLAGPGTDGGDQA